MAQTNKANQEKTGFDNTQYKIPYYDWNLKFRNRIEGKPNILKYMPMWKAIYEDNHPFIMLVIARQLGKTTWAGGLLAYYGTQDHTKGVYVTFSDQSLSTFSNDKYRQSILHRDNPEIFKAVRGADSGKGALSRVEFLTDSSTSLVTHANEMHHVEGQSADILVLDEAQNLDLDSYERAKESQAWTQGRTIITGVGGYIGTLHHKYWLSTDQREWEFKKEYWRDKLEFDQHGLVWDDYLIDLLDGEWKVKAAENYHRHGYHINQLMFPKMPLTKQEAVEKYKVSYEYSLEYKRERYPSTWYQRHVLANFIKGQTKPFSKESLLKCFFKSKSFVKPEDVDHSKGKVYASADWGGGNTAFTIPLVTQCLDENGPIFRVLWIERIDEQDVEKQADIFINLCNAYEVDHIAIDAGGGPRQAQKVETTFADRCTKISYIVRPDMPLPRESEKEIQNRENRFSIDRTYSIDRLKDLIDHPYYLKGTPFARWIIPAADPEKVMWIIEHFESVEGEIKKLKSTGQDYVNYTHAPGHPDDAMHSFNYNWIAQMINKDSDIYIKSF